MRKTRKIAALGAAGALGAPTALALADEPAGSAAEPVAPAVPIHARLAGEPTMRAQMRSLHFAARFTSARRTRASRTSSKRRRARRARSTNGKRRTCAK